MGPQVAMLPDGVRLHLQHGPIDLIAWADEDHRRDALAAAALRFRTILDELVAELPDLRRPDPPVLKGPVARRMQAATRPFLPAFITPMAAVAGAVADEVLAAMAAVPGLGKAHVNNGGDIAFHLAGAETVAAAMPGGRVRIAAGDRWRGMATSGWRGRSQSLGIADAVTVLARDAAAADAAATMIANAVDLPGHPAIRRVPAVAVKADSDLGDRPVTVAVGALSAAETAAALAAGAAAAETFLAHGLIGAAHLTLNGQSRTTGAALRPLPEPETTDA